ncbi:MAG: TatD family hydrolase [Oscillospiraceae bacterium]|jgi:TatD DNase family protein|nr:TatD family hydrolase [Oscillospiraceae bacterium]
MIFDTHAHYNDPRYDGDREALLASLPGAGVGRVLMPGTSVKEQPAVLAIAARYEFIDAAAGIHPHYPATKDELSVLEGYLRASERHKIAAVGECGLDYFNAKGYPPPDRAAQREMFDAHLCLAERYNLPVIVHDRDAHGDCLDIVRAHPGLRYVFHCFSGDAEMARTLCGMGIYISFTGSVTYKKNTALREAAAAVPDDLLMVETDAPYLAPEPLRGKRCDSLMIPHILAVLAQARGQTAEDAERLTWDNAVRFFG